MRHKKIISFPYGILRWAGVLAASVVLQANIASAANVNFPVDTTVSFTSPVTSLVVKANSSADTFVVNATSAVITVTAGTSSSTLESSVTNFTVSGGTLTCETGNVARVVITQTGSVTVTPTGTACGYTVPLSTTVTVSGGGGGGGGGYTPPVAATTTATTTVAATVPAAAVARAPLVAQPQAPQPFMRSPVFSGVPQGFVFQSRLTRGMQNNEVKVLQGALQQIPGVYPSGLITGYFGPATRRAVGLFQEKYGIAQPGGAGYGDIGPSTRKKLNELISGQGILPPAAPAAATAVSGKTTEELKTIIKTLQQQLVQLLAQLAEKLKTQQGR